jgi:hypothetical protein
VDDEPSSRSDRRVQRKRNGDVRRAEGPAVRLVDVERAALFAALRFERVDEQVGRVDPSRR